MVLVSSVVAVFEAVGLGGVPWLTQLRALRYHFETSQGSLAPLFNTLATIFAVAFIFYYSFAPPASLILFSAWWALLLIALACGVVFVVLYIFHHDAVKAGQRRWPIIVGLLAWIGFFCFLSAAFGNLNVYASHHILSGSVTATSTSEPLEGAVVEVELSGTGEVFEAITDSDGEYRLAMRKSAADSVRAVLVKMDGYEPKDQQVFGTPSRSYSFELDPIDGGTP